LKPFKNHDMKNFKLQKIAFAAFMVLASACFFSSCTKLSDSPVKTLGTQQVIVSTLAGGGVGSPGTVTDPIYGQVGSANGTGTAASFKAPAGVVMDAAGNLYVSEAGNYMIRKITPAGVVTTFAGSTTGGFTNGIGAAASFSAMQGIAIDASGNIYVADSGNQVIRKVTPDGTVSTFAGTGVMGSGNGPAASATFDGPAGVAVDAAGNVYVADFGNKMIRKISAGGIVSTLAGSGTVGYDNGAAGAASFTSPDRLAVDASGNVYVSDFKMVRKITADGTVSTLAGNNVGPEAYSTPVDGKGAAAAFAVADGITIDAAGNLYVGDENLVRKVTPDGTVTTLAGGGTGSTTDGTGKQASFGILRGITVNSAGNLIYAADYFTSLIRKIVIQ
jgi:NHL repeat